MKLAWFLFLMPLPIAAQAGGTPCNDQDRIPTTNGGTTSTGTANCPTFSITVQVGAPPLQTSITFNSPAVCDTGR